LNLVSPSRRFVREGTFHVMEKGKPHERTVYLFNDLLVITRPAKTSSGKDHFKYQLSLNEAKIIDVADTDDTQNACEIRPKQSEDDKQANVIVFGTPDQKKLWVREIKGLVKEFQRKQYLESQRAASKLAELEASTETKRCLSGEVGRKQRSASTITETVPKEKARPVQSTPSPKLRRNTSTLSFGPWRKSKDRGEKPQDKSALRSSQGKSETSLRRSLTSTPSHEEGKSKKEKASPKPQKKEKVPKGPTVQTPPAEAKPQPLGPGLKNSNFSAQLAAKLASRAQ